MITVASHELHLEQDRTTLLQFGAGNTFTAPNILITPTFTHFVVFHPGREMDLPLIIYESIY